MSNLLKAWTKSGGRDSFSAVKSMFRDLSMATLIQEGKKTAILAVPLIIGQVSQMLMMIADTKMVGEVGVTELAALTFGNTIFSILFVFGIGLMTSISILSSGAAGKKDHEEARSVCRNGFYLALAAGSLLTLIGLGLLPFLHFFKQPPEVTALTPDYLVLVVISLIPALASMGLKNHGDSLGHPWPSFWIFLSGVFLNIGLNQLLIFELEMGLVGAGWATLISRIAILIAVIIWMRKSATIREFVPRRWFAKINQKTMKRLFTLGIPASFQVLAEWGAFTGAAILIGFWGEVALGAHQIALTTSATFFMVPLGVGMALTMRIGNATGADEVRRYPALILSGLAITLVSVFITGLTSWLGREGIAGFFVKDQNVLTLAICLVTIVAISQVVDAIQIVCSGILRGMEDVTAPAWTAFCAYWVFGIPSGWLLATWGGMGAEGIWWGLALGLAVAAIALSFRVFIMMKMRVASL